MTRARRDDGLAAVDARLRRVGVTAVAAEAEELPHNHRLTAGVWRVRSRDGRRMVLKYLCADREPGERVWDRHWTSGNRDPERWNYWAREPLAYQHHLTDVYSAAGIRAPACLGCLVDDREALLLLDWVDGEPGENWPIGAYGIAAEALGRAQAPLLDCRRNNEESWLSRGFLRQYSSEKPVDWDLLDDEDAWQHPIVRDLFPPGLREDLVFVHANRERLYCINESLPQTLCHLDVWPKNLFRGTTGGLVLIDWGFVGRGALGEDAGNLVPDACFDHFVAAEHLPDLDQVVFDGYLRGSRAAGWNDDPQLIRLGMWSSSVKYDWLGPFMLSLMRQERQYRYGGGGEIDGAFMFRERSRALQFNAGWARSALGLADDLGL